MRITRFWNDLHQVRSKSKVWKDKQFKEEFEDTKGATRIRISKKNRQHNGQKKKVQQDKQRSTKHTYKTKDRVTRTPLNTGGELRLMFRKQ